jgi:hypothetical protein
VGENAGGARHHCRIDSCALTKTMDGGGSYFNTGQKRFCQAAIPLSPSALMFSVAMMQLQPPRCAGGARQSERRGTLERIRDPRLPLPGSFPQVLLAETRTVDFSGGARRGVFRGRLRLRRVRSLDPLNLKRIIPAKETARRPPAGCCLFRIGGAFRVGRLAS